MPGRNVDSISGSGSPHQTSTESATGAPKTKGAADEWPTDRAAQAQLLVNLDKRERRRIRHLERDPVRRARIVDVASDRLFRRVSSGQPPERPQAWFRVVVDNLLRSKEVPRSRTSQIERPEELAAVNTPKTDQAAPSTDAADETEDRNRQLAWAKERVAALSPRQRAVIDAWLGQDGSKAAARATSMAESNFRRTLTRALAALNRMAIDRG